MKTIKHKIPFLKKDLTKTTPKRIAVELTSRCNLNCPFCLVGQQNDLESTAHSKLPRAFGDIDEGLMNKIIKDAADFGMEEILLTFQGEPLLHKRAVEFVKRTKAAGLNTCIFTNGLLLTPEYSEQLIDAGLDRILFSVDGATQDVYKINRVGGKFEKVYQNMKEMRELVKKKKSKLIMEWQFIALKNNEHEIPLAEKMAKAIDVRLVIKTFAESVPDMAATNKKYKRDLQVKPCTDPYKQMFVYWDGRMVPCCYDLSGKEVQGNVKDQTIKEIWEGENFTKFKKMLKDVETNPSCEAELCKNCLKWKTADI